MQLQREYRGPEESFDLFGMLPDGPAWNYLYAVLEPEIESSFDLYGTVKITRGVALPCPEKVKTLHHYPTVGTSFIIGAEDVRTRWKRVEIMENEPHWIKQARTFLLNNNLYNEAAKIYILKELEFLRNAYHFEGEEKPESDLRIWAYHDMASEDKGKLILGIRGDEDDKEMKALIQYFDPILDPIPRRK